MVSDQHLNGIHLIACSSMQSMFIEDYRIHAITRYILIDTVGNIINSNAPGPTDPVCDILIGSLLN